MSKIWGTLRKNEKKGNSTKAPELKGSVRIGGYTGNNCDERNRESAQFLKFLSKEFSESQETWISLAIWKRSDEETGEPYLSICIEDNSWKKDSDSPAKKAGGNGFKPAPKAVSDEELWD
jgi:hypothetical protein